MFNTGMTEGQERAFQFTGNVPQQSWEQLFAVAGRLGLTVTEVELNPVAESAGPSPEITDPNIIGSIYDFQAFAQANEIPVETAKKGWYLLVRLYNSKLRVEQGNGSPAELEYEQQYRDLPIRFQITDPNKTWEVQAQRLERAGLQELILRIDEAYEANGFRDFQLIWRRFVPQNYHGYGMGMHEFYRAVAFSDDKAD
jgi:hypothetical protein